MNNMINYYEHPYLLASSFNNLQKDFYKKYIINQFGGSKEVGNNESIPSLIIQLYQLL